MDTKLNTTSDIDVCLISSVLFLLHTYPCIAMLLSLFSPANASPCFLLPPYSSTELIVKCSRDYQIGDQDEPCRFENGAGNGRGGKEG